MKILKPFTTLREAHSRDACYFGDRPDWLVVLSRHRDSDISDQSNFDSALEMLGGEGEYVAVEESSHWAVGWVRYIAIAPGRLGLIEIAQGIRDSLEGYPLLDEEDCSKREYEEYISSWDSWGRLDYTKAIARLVYSSNDHAVYTSAELSDAVGELTDAQIDELVQKARQSVAWEYQCEGSGVSINIDGLIKETDIGDVEALCVKVLTEEKQADEITKLGVLLGACPAQISEATSLRFDRVTSFYQLMQGTI